MNSVDKATLEHKYNETKLKIGEANKKGGNGGYYWKAFIKR
ncbi:hypothetical protein [Gallibacter intestinalis]|nr:hypothetical protein [Gallibacter intestinalis]